MYIYIHLYTHAHIHTLTYMHTYMQIHVYVMCGILSMEMTHHLSLALNSQLEQQQEKSNGTKVGSIKLISVMV